VLTKTQLRTAKTQELERLQARIQAELETRVQQELQRLKREHENKALQAPSRARPARNDPSDRQMAERYGLTQEPIEEAEVVEAEQA
jgi:hypothetical protein